MGELTIHIRRDGAETNDKAVMLCGMTFADLRAAGHQYFFEGESHHRVTCQKCLGGPAPQIGTPLSELSGRPGHRGYARFVAIAKSWGYE